MKFKLLIICFFTFSIYTIAQVSFEPYKNIVTGSWPEVVSIGDVNNDGRNDVVLATEFYFDPINDYKLFVYIQNSVGGLEPPVKYSFPTSEVNTIDIKDLNNDGRNDVIIGHTDSIGIFYQNSFGGLNPLKCYYSGTKVNNLKCGDLNNDGLNDVAVSHRNELFIKIFYQTTGLGFVTATFNKTGYTGLYDEIDVSDITGDNLNDVVYMPDLGPNGPLLYKQNSLGSLDNYISYFPTGAPDPGLNGIALGDIDNDGKKDLVASLGGNKPNSKIAIWKQNNITGSLITPPSLLNAYDIPEPIEIADLNCDNKNEIITLNGGWMTASIYEQDSMGNINNYKLIPVPYASHYRTQGLAIGDINNDGRKDLAIADYNSGLVLLINNSKSNLIDTISFTQQFDTIHINNYPIKNSYTDTLKQINNNYLITKIDSFIVTYTFSKDSIKINSLMVLKNENCGVISYDSIYDSYAFLENILTKIDTVLIATKTFSNNIIREIEMFPIPASDYVTFLLPPPYDTKNLSVEVFNELGQKIISRVYNDAANKRVINIENLAVGNYYIRLYAGNNKLVIKKMIVVK